ncbi:MAG: EpsG family protein [Prevotella sp.]|jgi:hypothetical protein
MNNSPLISIPYVLLVVFLGILSIVQHQNCQDRELCHRLKIVGLGIFFIFFAFRGFIFTDWITYYPEFEDRSWDDLLNYNVGESREPGFLLLELLCKSIIDNYHFFVFVCTAINVWLLVRFFQQYSTNIFLSLAIYLVFDGFVISINLMRNAIAICICLNALPYLFNRKPLEYFGLVLLAIMFHFSAILFLPFYFFLHRKLNRWVYLGIFILFNIIFLAQVPILLTLLKLSGFGGDFLADKLEYYTTVSGHLGIGLGYLERLCFGTLVFCYYNKLMEMRPENRMFINALIGYFLSTFVLSEFAEIGSRFRMLFGFAYWILWIELIKCFYYKNNRSLYLLFISLYCVLKTVTTINQPIQSYQNFLLGNVKSYQESKYIFEKTFEEPEY